MRLTSSFAVFRAEPGEEALAKARYHAREGHIDWAERTYREVLAEHPALHAGWVELFELLRRDARHEDALAVADEASRAFGGDAATPLALRGAALAELGRTREAIEALEAALERDGNLALAWHELAYAAFRTGELPRALLALDRAFTLEPHIDSLMLRGRILREAGQYEAAEVAFDGAMQAAEYDIPRRDAERELEATRRAGALGGRKPKHFTPRERWFVELGSVVLATAGGEESAEELVGRCAACLAAVGPLVRRLGWHPAAVAGAEPDDEALAAWVARALGADHVRSAALDPGDRPLIVTVLNHGAEDWSRQIARLARWRAGATFALLQQPGTAEPADLVGCIRPVSHAGAVHAAREALARVPDVPPSADEAALLAASPAAPWRRRIAGA
jgi:tetratricopeptide (TPR) repeat protein